MIIWDDSCVLLDCCSGRMLRVPKGTKVENVGDGNAVLDMLAEGAQSFEMQPEIERRQLMRLAEAARRIGRKPKTLHNWIARGELRAEHGLIKSNGRWLVDWPKLHDYLRLSAKCVASDDPRLLIGGPH